MGWKINGVEYGTSAGSTIYVTSEINDKVFLNYKTISGKYLPFCYSYDIQYQGSDIDPPSGYEYTDCDNQTQNGNVDFGNPSAAVCCFLDTISITEGPEIGITLGSICSYY